MCPLCVGGFLARLAGTRARAGLPRSSGECETTFG